MLGRALFATGNHRGAGEAFQAAQVAIGTEDPSEAVRILLDYALSCWMTAGPGASLTLMLRARELVDGVEGALRARVESAHSFLSLLVGDGKGLPVGKTEARTVEAGPQAKPEHFCATLGTLAYYGWVAALADRLGDPEGVCAAVPEAERAPSPGWAAASLAVTQAVTAMRRGRLKEGLDFANRAAAMAHVVPMIRSFAGAAQAEVLLQLGCAAESQACCAEAEEIAASRDERLALVWLWHVRAQQRSHEGRLDEACRLYRRIEDLSGEMGLGEPCLVPWASHAIDAYVRCDLRGDASRVVEWLRHHSVVLPCRWPRMALARGQAALAAAGGAHDAAEAHLRTALALNDGIDLPVEKAEILLTYGSFLRRTGQSARARPLLAEALRLAEAAGAA